ncbi:hypothetical protein EDE04_3950 [Streptomyces sp. 2132.2]|uniref:hypothetical protein n=1 Tax=Streptomyces sp. 2132.2 TaxID=2485161 RepID=UPI000C1A5F7E|nr:hypothetical protein [Streptomyces sp. 2132.2]ROQ97452.1 hypothetical protein EDE04_3950 [Streptomyces sp. 2132.2]
MVTFDTEWAGLKQQAAAGADMRLASAAPTDGGGGGGSGDLKSDKAVWDRGSKDLAGLSTTVKGGAKALETGQKGAAPAGVESATAQAELYQSWKTYLENLAGKCTSLQGPLEKAGQGQYKNDAAIESGFRQIDAQYKDTPATGGSDGGR